MNGKDNKLGRTPTMFVGAAGVRDIVVVPIPIPLASVRLEAAYYILRR
jgi:hypothetical protein